GKTRMQRGCGVAEQVAAAEQGGAVVDVAAVGRAAPGGHDASIPQLGEVVRDQVLRLRDQPHQFADATIAATELGDELPAQWIAEESEDRRRSVGVDAPVHQMELMQCNSVCRAARDPAEQRGRALLWPRREGAAMTELWQRSATE